MAPKVSHAEDNWTKSWALAQDCLWRTFCHAVFRGPLNIFWLWQQCSSYSGLSKLIGKGEEVLTHPNCSEVLNCWDFSGENLCFNMILSSANCAYYLGLKSTDTIGFWCLNVIRNRKVASLCALPGLSFSDMRSCWAIEVLLCSCSCLWLQGGRDEVQRALSLRKCICPFPLFSL